MPEIVNLIALKPDTKIQLVNGATAQVVSNPRDGVWVFARYLFSPQDPALVGTEDMVFAQDIVQVVEGP